MTVDYATANGTATAPSDYAAATGTLNFAAGETTKTISVDVNGDVLDESNTESFAVVLSGAANATIGVASGLGTITDDDPLPALSISDVTVPEGDTGTVAANFTVALSAPSGRDVTVVVATANATATAPGDYQPRSGPVTIPAGQTSLPVPVQVNGDTMNEANETYSVNLSSPGNATIADGQGVGTIIDDDPTPTVSINDISVTEGQSGKVNANFTVSLSAPSGQTVSVGHSTADGTGTAGADYTAGGGNLVFTPGQTSKTVTVQVNSDTVDEPDETFFVNLSGPVNAVIAHGQGIGTIIDDDGPATISIDDAAVTEGNNAGTVDALFTVSLRAPSGQGVTVEYQTANGSATAPVDYQPASGTLTFTPGEVTKTVPVQVNADVSTRATRRST